MKFWREMVYLAICTMLTSYYLSVMAFACRQNVKQTTYELKSEEIMAEPVKIRPSGGDFVLKLVKKEEPEMQKRTPYQWNDWSDVRKPSGITAEELHNAMYYDENNYAPFYIEAEKKYGVNAIFLYAIAQNESQNGRSKVAQRYNNLFGWMSANIQNGNFVMDYIHFSSPRNCIMTVASVLSESYLKEGNWRFEGYGIEEVNVHYNGTQHWAELTREIADMVQNEVIASQRSQGII